MIDIIIPMYNAEKTIDDTLKSVINQSYGLWRVIVIDDGSTDNSGQIVKKYMKKSFKIEYYYQKNGGVIQARIAGIQHLKNRYAFFLDSDDILHKQCLEILSKVVQNSESDIVMLGKFKNMSKHGHFRAKERYFIENVKYTQEDVEKVKMTFMGAQNYIPELCGKLIRRELLINALQDINTIPKNLKTGEDMCMNLCIFKAVKSVVEVDAELYNYRYSNTYLNKSREKAEEVIQLYKWRAQYIERERLKQEYHKMNFVHAYYLLLFYRTNDIEDKTKLLFDETEKYMKIDRNKYIVPRNKESVKDSFMIRVKRWVLKNL